MDQRPQPLPEAWRNELRNGLESLSRGEFEHAEACFARAHQQAPDRPEVCFALGRERLRQGRIDEAESLLRDAVAGDPALLSAATALARCLGLHRSRFEEAHEVLDEAMHRHGPSSLIDVVRAEILLDEGRMCEAREAAEQAIAAEDDPTSTTCEAARAALARIHNQDGIALAQGGALEQALFSFKRAADLDPRWSSPRVNMGAAFASLGKRQPARAAFEAAAELDPGSALARFNLGLLSREEGDPRAACDHLEASLLIDPDLDAARAVLAEIWIDTGDPDRACAVLSERLERNPADPKAWTDLGTAMVTVGDREGAEACFRQALELEPEQTAACRKLADLLTREGRYLEAAVLACRGDETDKPARRRPPTSPPRGDLQ